MADDPAPGVVTSPSDYEVQVAVPFDEAWAAVGAVLGGLERQGLGRWRVGDLAQAVPVSPTRTTVPLWDPVNTRPRALFCDEVLRPLTAEDRMVLAGAARLIATLIAAESNQVRLRDRAARAERESTIDALTDLPNARAWWRLLSREAARCDRHELSALVAVVDLDELKAVNDRNGHIAGDALILSAARVLRSSVRQTDEVARLGGDEFGILAVAYDAPQSVLVEHVSGALSAAGIAASVGAARYFPGDRINDVFHQADQEMYRVKKVSREQRRSAG